MPAPTSITPLSMSYLGEDGRLHFVTSDGLPPNNGIPPPPGPALLPPSSSAYGLQGVSEPIPVPPIQALYLESYRPPSSLQPPLPQGGCINIKFIQNGVRPHRDRFTGRDRDEEIVATTCRVATTTKVGELIREMGGSGVMGITECKLLADGRTWSPVQTFKLGDDNVHKTLADVGWTESRGVDGPPVWISPFHPGLEEEEEARYWRRRGFLTP
ncbi:hypothetical protein MMC22_001368 [Lobaria immixta]|nr:hypothetical protein [Lobaria immixta]